MQVSSAIGLGIVSVATGASIGLYVWSALRIRFISRHRLVRLRQIRRELRHGH